MKAKIAEENYFPNYTPIRVTAKNTSNHLLKKKVKKTLNNRIAAKY